ncbi:MAG TPA: hypothetical protein DDE71_01450 [Tenacibaculum sp.]|nr:hypothetical protein [Tenacibaculum sp.]
MRIFHSITIFFSLFLGQAFQRNVQNATLKITGVHRKLYRHRIKHKKFFSATQLVPLSLAVELEI